MPGPIQPLAAVERETDGSGCVTKGPVDLDREADMGCLPQGGASWGMSWQKSDSVPNTVSLHAKTWGSTDPDSAAAKECLRLVATYQRPATQPLLVDS